MKEGRGVTHVQEINHRRIHRRIRRGAAAGHGAEQERQRRHGDGSGAAGTRSHHRSRCGDCRSHALQYLRDADQDQRGRFDVALAGRELDRIARPEDLYVQAAQGRQIPQRRAVWLRRGEVLVRTQRGGDEHEQGQEPVPELREDRSARCRHGRDHPEICRAEPALPAGAGKRVDRRAEERTDRCDATDRHRSLPARRLGQGLFDHAEQMGGLSQHFGDQAVEGDDPLHLRSGRADRGAALGRRRRVPARVGPAHHRAVQGRSALQRPGRRLQGQDHRRHQRAEEAAR